MNRSFSSLVCYQKFKTHHHISQDEEEYSIVTNHNITKKLKQEPGENKQVIHPIPPTILESKDNSVLTFPIPKIHERPVNQGSLNSFLNGVWSE